MHNPFEPELSSGSLKFQFNEAFHYPISKMIALRGCRRTHQGRE